MSMPNALAQVVADLSMNDGFRELWKYYNKQADLMTEEILSSSTDPVSREILVRVHEMFRREVVDLPSRASKQLEQQTAGQAKAPVKE